MVLRGTVDGRYSMFFGQDFGDRDIELSGNYVVNSLQDIREIPTNFDLHEFENIFFRNFRDTQVAVDSIASNVYIFRFLLDNPAVRGPGRGRIRRVFLKKKG